MKSGRSYLSRSIAPPSARSNFTTGRASQVVYHCDRAATMIPNEDQWKSIIEKGIKESQQKEAAKMKASLDKRREVQAEQLKQMALKHELAKKEKDDFRAAFLQNGTSAYDKFYAFQDKHQAEANKIKTEAKRNAATLGNSYSSLQADKLTQMKKEAMMRQEQLDLLEREKQEKKAKDLQKKMALAEAQKKDQAAKLQFR